MRKVKLIVHETYQGKRKTEDVFAAVKTVTDAAGTVLTTNTYAARNNGLSSSTYGNGDTIEYTYNKLGLLGQVTRINNGNQQVFKWGYAADGTPIAHRDIANNRCYHYQGEHRGRFCVLTELSNYGIVFTGENYA